MIFYIKNKFIALFYAIILFSLFDVYIQYTELSYLSSDLKLEFFFIVLCFFLLTIFSVKKNILGNYTNLILITTLVFFASLISLSLAMLEIQQGDIKISIAHILVLLFYSIAYVIIKETSNIDLQQGFLKNTILIILVLSILNAVVRFYLKETQGLHYNYNWAWYVILIFSYIYVRRYANVRLILECILFALIGFMGLYAGTRGVSLIALSLAIIRFLYIMIPLGEKLVGLLARLISNRLVFFILFVGLPFALSSVILTTLTEEQSSRVAISSLSLLGKTSLSGRELGYAYVFDSMGLPEGHFYNAIFGYISKKPIIYPEDIPFVILEKESHSWIYASVLQVFHVYGIFGLFFLFLAASHLIIYSNRKNYKHMNEKAIIFLDHLSFILISSLVYAVFGVDHTSLTFFIILVLVFTSTSSLNGNVALKSRSV